MQGPSVFFLYVSSLIIIELCLCMIVDSKDLPYTVICSSDNFSIVSHFLASFFFLLVYSPCRFRFFVFFSFPFSSLRFIKRNQTCKRNAGFKTEIQNQRFTGLYIRTYHGNCGCPRARKEMYNKSHETRLMRKFLEIIRKDSGVLKN